MKKAKSIEELQKAVSEAEEDAAKNEEKLEQAKDRLSKAVARCADLSEQIEAAKEEFIRLVNNNEDHKAARRKRKNLEEEKETEEAIITASKITIEVCEGLKEPLQKGILEARKELIKEDSIRYLVEEYNDLGKRMAAILKRLEGKKREYLSMRTDPYERPVVTVSRGILTTEFTEGALDFIPELSVDGESLKPLYSRREIIDGLRRDYEKEDRMKWKKQIEEKREEEARLREELERTYKDALCLRCAHYLGVLSSSKFLTCEAFYGGIPLDILTGKINHAVERVGLERLLFQEKEKKNQGK